MSGAGQLRNRRGGDSDAGSERSPLLRGSVNAAQRSPPSCVARAEPVRGTSSLPSPPRCRADAAAPRPDLCARACLQDAA